MRESAFFKQHVCALAVLVGSGVLLFCSFYMFPYASRPNQFYQPPAIPLTAIVNLPAKWTHQELEKGAAKLARWMSEPMALHIVTAPSTVAFDQPLSKDDVDQIVEMLRVILPPTQNGFLWEFTRAQRNASPKQFQGMFRHFLIELTNREFRRFVTFGKFGGRAMRDLLDWLGWKSHIHWDDRLLNCYTLWKQLNSQNPSGDNSKIFNARAIVTTQCVGHDLIIEPLNHFEGHNLRSLESEDELDDVFVVKKLRY